MPPRDDDLAHWVRRGICEVPPAHGGERLDSFLASRFPYRSRTQWSAMIRQGRIRLNDKHARPGRPLRPGDRIEYVPDPRPEPRVSNAVRVLMEDDSMLALQKPANLPVHPSGRYFRNTLLLMLLEARGEALDETELRIVHRLDRETSGVILFGKGKLAAAALSRQFEMRTVRKRYLAIVHGVPTMDRFLIDAPIGPDASSPVRKAMTVLPGGAEARTSCRVLRRGHEHALILASPHTGRLHQIRVHLRHAGHPILGDKVYGLDPHLFVRFVEGKLTNGDRETLAWRRQALHAWKLTFRHPRTGDRIDLRAPVGRAWVRKTRELGLSRQRR
jgi:RluA family pseudouridine synthase